MPIPEGTPLATIPGMLAEYNAPTAYTACYNPQYNNYIAARNAGIVAAGSLGAWIAEGGAGRSIRALLTSFGMNARKSALTPLPVLQRALAAINPAIINWVAGINLPLGAPPPNLVNPATGETLSAELEIVYDALAAPDSVTVSGGYVAASKTMHCLFPELAP
jgi:hypothetical protein